MRWSSAPDSPARSVHAAWPREFRPRRVLVIDRRLHVAGNAYDALDEHGVVIHTYGPHIFHTNAAKVTDFLSRFTDWRPYEHRVIAEVDGRFVPMPINRTTVQLLHGVELPRTRTRWPLISARSPGAPGRAQEL